MRKTDLSPQDAQVIDSIEDGLKDKFLTAKKLCKTLGISRSAFYMKKADPGRFTLQDIRTIAEVLEVPSGKVLKMIYEKEALWKTKKNARRR